MVPPLVSHVSVRQQFPAARVQGCLTERPEMVLAFATDGDTDQLVGIALVCNGISLADRSSQPDNVVIAVPKSLEQTARSFLRRVIPFHIVFVPARHHPDDRYYVQLSLIDIARQCAQSRFVALDYDHILPGSTTIEWPMHLKQLNVSSLVTKVPTTSPLHHTLHTHYNISLISGHAEPFLKVAEYWEESYKNIESTVPVRNRTELAFSLAAQSANISLNPSKPELQASFDNHHTPTVLYHYGGNTLASTHVKQQLNHFSTNLGLSATSKDLAVLHRKLLLSCQELANRDHSSDDEHTKG